MRSKWETYRLIKLFDQYNYEFESLGLYIEIEPIIEIKIDISKFSTFSS